MIKIVSGEQIYDEVFDRGVRSAEQSVWIATANVKNAAVRLDDIATGPFLELFDRLAGSGVEIRLLHANVPSESFIGELKNHPALLRSPRFGMRKCVRTHFKCVLVDGRLMYAGSANLTGAGMGMKGPNRRNFELGFITDEDYLMDFCAEYFDSIWSGKRCDSCKRKKDCTVPLESPEF